MSFYIDRHGMARPGNDIYSVEELAEILAAVLPWDAGCIQEAWETALQDLNPQDTGDFQTSQAFIDYAAPGARNSHLSSAVIFTGGRERIDCKFNYTAFSLGDGIFNIEFLFVLEKDKRLRFWCGQIEQKISCRDSQAQAAQAVHQLSGASKVTFDSLDDEHMARLKPLIAHIEAFIAARKEGREPPQWMPDLAGLLPGEAGSAGEKPVLLCELG